MSNTNEMVLVGTILDLITVRGGVATRVNSGMLRIEKEDGTVRYVHGATKGTADILACFLGKYLAIEAKVWPRKPTVDQLEFGARVERAGGIFIVAYDPDIVIDKLDWIELGG